MTSPLNSLSPDQTPRLDSKTTTQHTEVFNFETEIITSYNFQDISFVKG